jgi:predicted permease
MLEPAGLLTGGASAFIRGLNFDAISLKRPMFLAFNLALSIAAGFCFGTLPALHGSRLQPNEGFAIARRRKYAARRIMLVAQVALAVVLLAGAGVMLRSFGKLLSIDVGVEPDALVVFRLELPGHLYPDDAPRQFFQNLLDNVGSLPGVEHAALANTIPLRGQNEVTMGTVDGREAGEVALHIVSHDYFQALGIPLIKGRSFTDDDRANSPHVAIISESAARRFFGDQDPIGHTITRVSRPGEEARIVGVAGNSKYRLIEMGPDADVYVSHRQAEPWPGNYVVIKSRMPMESMISLVRGEVRKLDSLVPIYDATTMNQVVANATARTRFSSVLLAIFAGLALVVAGVGVYGLLTYTVSQCTREIGIRIALGADRSHIGRIVVRDGLVLCLMGLVIGLAGAYGTTRLLGGLLYQITPTDPATFLGVACLFIGTAIVACWLPARRATRVDPIVALRHE